MIQFCKRCGEAFTPHKQTGKRQKWCGSKCRAANHAEKPKSKLKKRESRMQSLYGISMDEYNYLMVMQSDRCAICLTDDKGNNHSGPNTFWSVDHNHQTGEVRKLLCPHCNHMLGSAFDDPDILREGANYLEANNV